MSDNGPAAKVIIALQRLVQMPEPAMAADTVPNGAALRETPGMRARFRQMIHTREVPYPPALKYEGDWRAASAAICNDWISDQALR